MSRLTEPDLRGYESEAISAVAYVRSPYVKALAQRVGHLAQAYRELLRETDANARDAARLREALAAAVKVWDAWVNVLTVEGDPASIAEFRRMFGAIGPVMRAARAALEAQP